MSDCKRLARFCVSLAFVAILTITTMFDYENNTFAKPTMFSKSFMKCNVVSTQQEELLKIASIKKKCSKEKFQILPKATSRLPNVSGCDKPHIYIESRGRLGNQICEYLTMAMIRDIFSISVSIGPHLHRSIGESFDGLDIAIGSKSCNRTKFPYSTIFNMTFRDIPVQSVRLNKSYEISNYPCPVSILMDHRAWFSNLLTFKASIVSKADSEIEKALLRKMISRNETVLVGMHVRRTDYQRYLQSYKKIRRSYISRSYYQNAMDYYSKLYNNVAFIVSSDDIEWCKKNLDHPNVVFLDNNKSSPIVDMAVLTLCDHHVTGFGTFGFLGAYLGRTGTILHSYSLDEDNSEFEEAIFCSDSPDLIAKPDGMLCV